MSNSSSKHVEDDAMWQKALNLRPNDPNVLCGYATFLAQHACPDEAERMYNRCLEIDGRHLGALCNFAVLLENREKLFDACTLYERALEVDPAQVIALSNYGHILCRKGDFDRAEDILKQALRKYPNDVTVLHNYGCLLWEGRRDYRRAEEVLRRALKNDPSHEPSQAALKDLTKDMEGAERRAAEQAAALLAEEEVHKDKSSSKRRKKKKGERAFSSSPMSSSPENASQRPPPSVPAMNGEHQRCPRNLQVDGMDSVAVRVSFELPVDCALTTTHFQAQWDSAILPQAALPAACTTSLSRQIALPLETIAARAGGHSVRVRVRSGKEFGVWSEELHVALPAHLAREGRDDGGPAARGRVEDKGRAEQQELPAGAQQEEDGEWTVAEDKKRRGKGGKKKNFNGSIREEEASEEASVCEKEKEEEEEEEEKGAAGGAVQAVCKAAAARVGQAVENGGGPVEGGGDSAVTVESGAGVRGEPQGHKEGDGRRAAINLNGGQRFVGWMEEGEGEEQQNGGASPKGSSGGSQSSLEAGAAAAGEGGEWKRPYERTPSDLSESQASDLGSENSSSRGAEADGPKTSLDSDAPPRLPRRVQSMMAARRQAVSEEKAARARAEDAGEEEADAAGAQPQFGRTWLTLSFDFSQARGAGAAGGEEAMEAGAPGDEEESEETGRGKRGRQGRGVQFDVEERATGEKDEASEKRGRRGKEAGWPVVALPPSLTPGHTELSPRRRYPHAESQQTLTQRRTAERQESWDPDEMEEASRGPPTGSLPESSTLLEAFARAQQRSSASAGTSLPESSSLLEAFTKASVQRRQSPPAPPMTMPTSRPSHAEAGARSGNVEAGARAAAAASSGGQRASAPPGKGVGREHRKQRSARGDGAKEMDGADRGGHRASAATGEVARGGSRDRDRKESERRSAAKVRAKTERKEAEPAGKVEPDYDFDDYHGRDECVICFEGEKTHLVLPCGHLALCEKCAGLVGNELHKCPVCNTEATAPFVVKLFRS